MRSIKLRLIGGLHYDPITITVRHLDTATMIEHKTSAAQKKAVRDFDFHLDPDPSGVEITITIPRPHWATSGGNAPDETERIELALQASPSAPRGFRLTPASPPHPRLIQHEQLNGNQGTLLVVDLSFLDVTKYFDAGKLGALSDGTTHLLTQRKAQPYPGAVYNSLRPAECHARLYELTVGESPRLWAVSYLPATLLRRPFHFAVFLIPKTGRYEHPGEASLVSLQRYLLSPSLAAPFFLKNKANDPNQWNKREQLLWMQIPDCGFMEQLWRSGANAVLVNPVPNGEGPGEPRYGVLLSSGEPHTKLQAATQPPYRKGLRPLLDSLRRAMLRASHAAMWSIGKARIALGGFSAGAHDAALVLERNGRAVEQLYWLDPRTQWVRRFEPLLRAWLQLGPSKQLRLVGGNQHSPRPGFTRPNPGYTLLALRDRLVPAFGHQRVTLLPSSSDFFKSYMYASAVAAPAHAALVDAEAFDLSTRKASRRWNKKTHQWHYFLSGSCGVFVEEYSSANRPLVLEGRNGKAPPRARALRDLAPVPCNAIEAAGLLRVKYRQDQHYLPLHSTPQGPSMRNDVALWLTRATEDMRHQWAACGGDGDPLRDAGFVGHLHDCLKKGGL